MALSDHDRRLLARCLEKQPKSWEDFVDRFMGLVIHVINHSAAHRSLRLADEDREDIAGEVFLNIVRNDFALLRNFRGESSLATYLTVVTRRIVVANLMKRKPPAATLGDYAAEQPAAHAGNGHATPGEELTQNRDEVERLLQDLETSEAELVRLYHLEGKSYHEISSLTGVAENTIGPTLTRAARKNASRRRKVRLIGCGTTPALRVRSTDRPFRVPNPDFIIG
ncbi:MAG: sigma-70 family RNA polymerase sigma factor [Pirellulales bacterium]